MIKLRTCLTYALLTTAALSAKAEELVVSNFGVSANGMPFGVAMAKGYFKAEGLQVDVIEQSFAPSAQHSNSTSVLQVWSAPLVQSLQAARPSDPLLSVVQTGRTPQLALAAPRKMLTGMKSLKELEGKKIGIMEAGSLAQLCVDYAVLLAGGNPKNIN